MISRQIQTLFQRSKSTSHLLQLRSLILKSGLDRDQYFVSKFILSACPISTDLARLFIDSLPIAPPLFAWNTVIRFYTRTKNPIQSVELFSRLQNLEVRPDNFTYPFVLKACGQSSMLGQGGAVHSLVMKEGLDSDKYIGNTLLRMYAACDAIGLARKVFDEMTERDVVSWSSMIAGYVACNFPVDALLAFQHMKLVNEEPNSVTLVSLLSASCHLFNSRLGKSIHTYIIVNSIELGVALGTALLEMYSKCGHIEKAFQVFKSMKEKNLQSWTIMISGLADYGLGEDAISLFKEMKEVGLRPDSLSFSGILSSCSHLGLIDEGRRYFDEMVRIYGVEPTMEHYGCMVDLLGRAGLVDEAYEIIKNMAAEPNSVILRSFLCACRNHGRVVYVGDDKLRKLLLKVEPGLGANYVLASNVSSVHGSWNDAADLRASMKERGLKKVPGCSWVEIGGGSV